MSSKFYAVEMSDTRDRPHWLARGSGDPPRTYAPNHANRYATESAAKAAITRAKKTTPFKERGMKVAVHPLCKS